MAMYLAVDYGTFRNLWKVCFKWREVPWISSEMRPVLSVVVEVPMGTAVEEAQTKMSSSGVLEYWWSVFNTAATNSFRTIMRLMMRVVVSETIFENKNRKYQRSKDVHSSKTSIKRVRKEWLKSFNKNLGEPQNWAPGQTVTGLKAMVSLGSFLNVLLEFGMTKV